MSKIQQAEKTLRYATAALAMGLVRDDTPREMIVRLAFGARAALERVEALTVPAAGESVQ